MDLTQVEEGEAFDVRRYAIGSATLLVFQLPTPQAIIGSFARPYAWARVAALAPRGFAMSDIDDAFKSELGVDLEGYFGNRAALVSGAELADFMGAFDGTGINLYHERRLAAYIKRFGEPDQVHMIAICSGPTNPYRQHLYREVSLLFYELDDGYRSFVSDFFDRTLRTVGECFPVVLRRDLRSDHPKASVVASVVVGGGAVMCSKDDRDALNWELNKLIGDYRIDPNPPDGFFDELEFDLDEERAGCRVLPFSEYRSGASFTEVRDGHVE